MKSESHPNSLTFLAIAIVNHLEFQSFFCAFINICTQSKVFFVYINGMIYKNIKANLIYIICFSPLLNVIDFPHSFKLINGIPDI